MIRIVDDAAKTLHVQNTFHINSRGGRNPKVCEPGNSHLLTDSTAGECDWNELEQEAIARRKNQMQSRCELDNYGGN